MSTAIILAGGLGTRLRSEVPNLPKPMAPVNGRPFLSYLMDYWIDQGVKRIILSVGYKSYIIQDYYGNNYRHAELNYSVEEEPLGTGGGLLLALRQLQESDEFLVLNGDTFFAVEMDALQACHKKSKADMTMSLLDVANNNRYGGVKLTINGRIESLDASQGETTSRCVNGGVYLMNKQFFDAYGGKKNVLFQRSSLENDLFPALLKSGRHMYGHLSSGTFIDIGVPEDYKRAPLLLPKMQP